MTPRPISVLLLAAGSPGDYAFILGLKRSRKYAVTLHAADCDRMKGNLYLPPVDHAYLLPPCDAPGYEAALLSLVERTRADVLASDLDEELPALSALALRLESMNCRVFLPRRFPLEVCLDKYRTYERLHGHVCQPTTVLGDAGDPECGRYILDHYGKAMIKPRFLRGGRGVVLIGDGEALAFHRKRQKKPFIVQQYLPGLEYNVSICHGPDGGLIYCAERLKLDSRLVKSNTVAAQVVRNPIVREAALAAVNDLELARGFNNVEIIVSEGYPYVIDVNGARWAGQDMNILESGVNFAEMYLDLAMGEPVAPVEVPIGAISLKIKMDLVVREEELAAV